MAPVPGDVHILIAGFSCVDASALNNKPKELNETGESGDTLRALLYYAKKYRPKIIILENVGKMDWRTTKAYFENDWADPTVDLDQLKDIWGDDDPRMPIPLGAVEWTPKITIYRKRVYEDTWSASTGVKSV